MNTENQQTSRTIKDYIGLVARGFTMGAANVVPGVSGGTMAFITGIYEELITSIRDLLSPEPIKLVLSLKIKQAFDIWPWKFLLAVGAGVLIATFTLAPYLEWMLENQPVFLWSFFFGLVLASIFTVNQKVGHWGAKTFSAALIGGIAAYLVVGLVPAQTPDTAIFLFFSGFIASCAMILPGLSGSFILLILGKYQTILAAVTGLDIVTLFILAVGVGVGLVTTAQVLSWLFKRYHDVTIAILIGLMAGSLRKIWPWKETIEFFTDRHGDFVPLVQVNVLPATWTSEVTFALILAMIGFAVVFALEYWASRQDKQEAVST